jgi:hypothetical protein
MEPVAVKIDYWTLPDGSPFGEQPEGIDEFRNDLRTTYTSLVRGHSGDCGGGLYNLTIEIVSSITIREVASLILGGVAYDLLKSGTHSLVLRPLLDAIEKLKAKNKKIDVSVDELKFSFQDAEVVIKQVVEQPLYDDLGLIFKAIAESHEFLKGKTGELPYVIHIPVFEDPNPQFCRYRSLLDVDETLEGITSDSYFKFWGVRYNLEGQHRVYDVFRRLLIDEEYMTQDEYCKAWERKWDKEN